jgi:hypothetical protein
MATKPFALRKLNLQPAGSPKNDPFDQGVLLLKRKASTISAKRTKAANITLSLAWANPPTFRGVANHSNLTEHIRSFQHPTVQNLKHMKSIHSSAIQPLRRHAFTFWLSLICAAMMAPTTHATLLLQYNFDEASGSALDSSGAIPQANAAFTNSATRTPNTPSGQGYPLHFKPVAFRAVKK